MYTCYDCELFGNGCRGMIPPLEMRNKLEEHCPKFSLLSWRNDMFKPSGRTRI
jgi:hypothetical protein